MHELGIVFHIADSLLAVGRENNLTSISSVTIELGEVSGVVDSYLTDCWRWTAEKHDLLRGCKMLIVFPDGYLLTGLLLPDVLNVHLFQLL